MKKLKKLLSVFLAIIMIVSTINCALYVFAEEINSDVETNIETEEETEEDYYDEEEEAEILNEDLSARTEFSKTYLMSDGSFQSGIFSQSVHTQNEDGEWVNRETGDNSVSQWAYNRDFGENEINGTYYTSTDTEDTDHSSDSHIYVNQNSYGVINLSFTGLPGMQIKSTYLYLPVNTAASEAKIYAYVLDNPNPDSFSFSYFQSLDLPCVDYAKVRSCPSGKKFIELDISSAINNNENAYVILRSESSFVFDKIIPIGENDNGEFFIGEGEEKEPKVTYLINYFITTGLDSDFEYNTYDLGSAGQIYINKQSGNLVIKRDDISTGDGDEAYNITSTFNSLNVLGDFGAWFSNIDISILYGILFIDENMTFNILYPNGTVDDYTLLKENEYGFEKIKITDCETDTLTIFEGTPFETELTITTPTVCEIIANEGTRKYIFTADYGITEIIDISGQTPHSIFGKVVNENGSINIFDGDGNTIVKTETNSTITFNSTTHSNNEADAEIIYKDAESNITRIDKDGELQALYTYDSNNRMTSITDNKGHKLTLTYEGDTGRVNSVSEIMGTVSGETVSFTRTPSTCVERTSGADGIYGNTDDLLTTYTFNNSCKLICTNSKTVSGEDLGAVSYVYDNDEISNFSISGKVTDNLFKNHNIQSKSYWPDGKIDDTGCLGTAEYTTEKSYVGNGSIKVNVTDCTATGGYGIYQAINISSGLLQTRKTYTASVYSNVNNIVRDSDCSSNKNCGSSILVKLDKSDGSSSRIYSKALKTDNDWERLWVSFTVPAECEKVTVYFLIRNATGTAYFDAAQLEEGNVPEPYNRVENNSFNYTTNWKRYDLTDDDQISDGAMHFIGSSDKKKNVYQDILLDPDTKRSDKFVLSGIAQANSVPIKDIRRYDVRVKLFCHDDNNVGYVAEQVAARFDKNSSDKQYTQIGFDLNIPNVEAVPYKIRVVASYDYNENSACFDGLSLIKTEDVIIVNNNYTYDENGKILTYTDDDGVITTYTYDTDDKLISKSSTNGFVTTYTYSDNGNYLVKEETRNPNNTVISYIEYDSKGNITEELSDGLTTIYTYSNNGEYLAREEVRKTNNNNIIIISYVEYNSAGNITEELSDGICTTYGYTDGKLTSKSSTDGLVTTYFYSQDDGHLTEEITKDSNNTVISDVKYDSDGNITYESSDGIESTYVYDNGNLIRSTVDNVTTNYSYDADGNMVSKEQDGRSVSYAYDSDDKLTSVSRNNTVYNYTYDVWGRPIATKVGSQALETASYNTNGTLSSKTYGNGNVENYTYNSYGQVKKISLPGLGSYSFRYDSKGTKLFETDYISNQKTYYYYDEAGRSTGEHVSSRTNSNTFANDIYDTKIVYNDDGEVSKTSVASSTVKFENNYSYTETETGRQASSSFTDNRSVVSVYDGDSRLSQRTITTNTPFVQTYTYNEDSLITSETRGSNTYTYTYDNSGRITEIKKNNVLTQSYSYNSFGELVRENNLDTNKTVIYNYDNGGNITSKKEYAFTTGDVGTVQKTVNYTYGNSSWKDELTSYNGEIISYDAIGNPTNYRGATCTYFGRQLQTYTKGSTSISYKYDSDGLRTSKTVNGVQHDYYYVDGVLMYEKVGSEYEMFYRYDNDGRLSMVTCRDMTTGNKYYYNVVTNAQGDVVNLLGGSGAVRVTYTYDAYGRLVSMTDSTETDPVTSEPGIAIGSKNSIRYRGYVYDSETEMYYLQSRYYDPETGRFINCDAPDYIGVSDTFTSWNGFAYCENDPIFNKDSDGCISFKSIKKYFSNVISEISKQLKKYFLSLIIVEKGTILISTTVIETLINTIISTFCTGKIINTTTKVFSYILKRYKNKAPQKIVDILRFVVDELEKKGVIYTIARLIVKKYIVREKIVKEGIVATVAKDFLSGILLSDYELLKNVNTICSAFSSIGGFFAFIISGFDKKWFDNYLKIDTVALRRKYL